MVKIKGLGRGLDALLGGDNDAPAAAVTGDAVNTLPVNALQPGKYQPRTRMDQEALNALAASIKAVADASWAEIVPAMNTLNGVLAKTQWLAGNSFTVADLNVASALYRGLSMDLSQWPAVKEWLERCWARPAGKKARAMRE